MASLQQWLTLCKSKLEVACQCYSQNEHINIKKPWFNSYRSLSHGWNLFTIVQFSSIMIEFIHHHTCFIHDESIHFIFHLLRDELHSSYPISIYCFMVYVPIVSICKFFFNCDIGRICWGESNQYLRAWVKAILHILETLFIYWKK